MSWTLSFSLLGFVDRPQCGLPSPDLDEPGFMCEISSSRRARGSGTLGESSCCRGRGMGHSLSLLYAGCLVACSRAWLAVLASGRSLDMFNGILGVAGCHVDVDVVL